MPSTRAVASESSSITTRSTTTSRSAGLSSPSARSSSGDSPSTKSPSTRSLAAGETTYTWQRGIPELRQAIATYASDLYGRELSPERFFVCGSGMQAIQIAMTMVAGPGDEILIPSPTWPNAPAAAGLRGATPVFVALDHGNRGWQIDLDKLEAAITPKTKAMFINTPSNPTGWTATKEELASRADMFLMNHTVQINHLRNFAAAIQLLKGETFPSVVPGGQVFAQRRALGVM